jgi:hypothetical protein
MSVIRSLLVPAAVLAIAIGSPAAALQRFNVYLQGELVQQSGANLIPGLPFTTGSTLQALWEVDLRTPNRITQPPFGGTGTAARFNGAVSGGIITLASETGIMLMFQNTNSLGGILAIDNSSLPPNPQGVSLRADQLTYSDGAGYSQFGPVAPYDIIPVTKNIPQGLFVSMMAFGRSQTGLTDPALLTGTEAIDPFTLWQFPIPGPQPLFNIQFRQGTATTITEANALPTTRFSLRNAIVQVTEITDPAVVPEPSSWAMLILGFGLVGAVARQQRRREMAAA